MKKRIFITTSIIIFLFQLLCLSSLFTASALESGVAKPVSASIQLYNISDSAEQNQAMQIFPSGQIPTDNSVDMDLVCAPNKTQYDNFLACKAYVYGYAYQSYGWIHVNYGVTSFKEFNTVNLQCNVFASDFLGYDPSDYFRVMFNDDEITEGYTIAYTLSDVIETHSDAGQYMKYRRLNIRVYFDKPYLYDSLKVDLFFKTYIPPTGAPTRYLIGCNNLKFEKLSAEDFASETASGINNLNNKVDQTNAQLGVIGDSMDDIKNLLSVGMDEETAQKIVEGKSELAENSIKLETNREYIEDVDQELEGFFQTYEDIEYDLFGDSYMNYVDEYVDPVFESQGFLGFWNGLFSDPFVMGMIIVSLTFCAVGFAMYGVR